MSDGGVLVTGGAGFIGANLVPLLLAAGHRVTVLDDLSAGRRRYLEGLEIRFVEGDVRDRELVPRLVAEHGAIVHLASQTGVPGSIEDPRHDCDVNVLGTLNLLEACRARPGRAPRFVFASSNAPLGRQKPPASEDKAPLPISPYGASKLAAEGYCLAYHGSWALPTVVLRFANVYGPFSAHKGSVVAEFFRDALAARPIVIDGDGGQTRDFVFVGDLCAAILAALETEAAGEVFQLATGVETSILELAGLVRAVTDRELEARHGPVRQGDIRKNYSDIGKAERLLGWRPQVELREGLERTWAWFAAGGVDEAAAEC